MRFSSFKTVTITAGVWRLFAVAVIIFLMFSSVLYFNIKSMRDASADVLQTQNILNDLYGFKNDLLNAETGQRGYLLTQDKKYLEPFITGEQSSTQRMARLTTLIRDPETMTSINEMKLIVSKKFAELQRTINLTEHGQYAEAMTIVKNGSGKAYMDEFRRLNNQASARQLKLLESRQKLQLNGIQRLVIAVLLSTLFAVIILFTSTRQTVRQLSEPISALLNGMNIVAAGQLDFKIPIDSEDEIGRISKAFNQMSEDILIAYTQLDETMTELKRSNIELDTFAYVASHDLKAPLRGIRSLAQWIEEDIVNIASEDTRENLRLLKVRVDRLDSLLESLLAYSRIGRTANLVEEVDTSQLITEISDYLAPGLGFSIVCEKNMPKIFTAKAPLELVLRNLISNAVKHHDQDTGRISISAQEKGQFVQFKIDDDGPGIPAEFHQRIFQMFQTLKPRDQVEGSGMGLAFVKKTVDSLGGEIHVESHAHARGTSFVLSWPKTVNLTEQQGSRATKNIIKS